jgi:hypothetical protein
MRVITFTLLCLLSINVSAQEYKPYPRAKITQEQWQQYFSEVSKKLATSRREFPSENLVVFEDRVTFTTYAFTQEGHAAHPAWVTRHVVEDKGDVSVRQIGYFAGNEEPFAKLFKSYQQLQSQKREDFERRTKEVQK